MAARLMIQRPGEPAAPADVGALLTVGSGERDGVRAPGLTEGALRVSTGAAGIVLEARAAGISVAGRPLAPGARRLLRPGERAQAADVCLWPEPAPRADGTRALAGAILAGDPPISGPRLVVVEGPAAGAALALADGAVLGRSRGAALRLHDSLASRRHAVFTVRRGRAHLRDLSSKNGLAVNGRRVGQGVIALGPGDALSIGESLLVYEDDAPPPAPADDGACEDAAARDPPRAHGPRAPTALAALGLVAAAVLLALAAG